MITAYIGLGSNLGDSLQVVLDAWERLGTLPGIQLGRLSHPYRTEPVAMDSDNWFVNAAGELMTSLTPGELLESLHRVEEQFGRRRDPAAEGYQDRVLDVDLLLYGQNVVMEDGVQVPHPALQDRLFVLLPMCDIAADVLHPVLGKSMRDLLTVLLAAGDNPVVEITGWPIEKISGEQFSVDHLQHRPVRKSPSKD